MFCRQNKEIAVFLDISPREIQGKCSLNSHQARGDESAPAGPRDHHCGSVTAHPPPPLPAFLPRRWNIVAKLRCTFDLDTDPPLFLKRRACTHIHANTHARTLARNTQRAQWRTIRWPNECCWCCEGALNGAGGRPLLMCAPTKPRSRPWIAAAQAALAPDMSCFR